MALTRAQLLMGNSSQGVILPGQPQGVVAGPGLLILSDGTIEFDSSTVTGVVKLGQTSVWSNTAYNQYFWPLAVSGTDVGKQLTVVSIDGSGNAYLEWRESDGIDWTARGQIIAATAPGETNDTLVNIGSDRSVLMSQVSNGSNLSGLAYSDVITSAMKLPVGPDGSRPVSPVDGEIRYNSTQNKLEVWANGDWETLISSDPATGSYVRQIASNVVGETDIAAIPAGTTAQRITNPAPQDGYLRFNADPNTIYNTSGSLEFWDGANWITAAANLAPAGFVAQTGTNGAAIIPAGNDIQRPTSPAGGYLRYNSVQNYLEFYNSASTLWELIAPSGGGVHSFVQATTPVAFNEGDFWYDTVRQRESVWDGAAWVQPGVTQTGPNGAIVTPSGDGTQRPSSPLGGYLRYNTDEDYLEFYNSNSTTWELLAPAVGGVHSFVQGATPNAFNTGDIWYDTNLQRESVWNGTAWVQPGVTQTSPTGAALLPVGTTAQQTGSDFTGALRFNIDTGKLEFWNSTTWEKVASQTTPLPSPLGTVTSVEVSGGTTGLTFSGNPITTAGTITMGGVLSVANGGTGTTTSAGGLNNLLPSQATEAGKVLTTDGTNATWQSVVSSFSAGTTGLSPSVATTGAVTLSGVLAVANGGTGTSSSAGAINNLLPSQAGNNGEYLTTDGTNVSWAPIAAGFPTGTSMPFAQAAAPTGWTQVTNAAYNDSSIRLVTSAGAGTGGSVGFLTLFSSSSSYSGTINITSGNVGSTTLSEAQLASHAHTLPIGFPQEGFNAGASSGSGNIGGQYSSSAAGGNVAHTHTLSGVAASGNFVSNFAVKYVNMIVATKN